MLTAVGQPDAIRTERGAFVPRIIYGTAWKKERTAALVAQALSVGFRGIDTACQPKHYDEPGVGAGLARAFADGLPRSDVFVQTKFTSLSGQDPRRVPYDPRASLSEQVRQSCRASLENLGVTYLDCMVLHSPMRRFDDTLTVWREMEALVDAGTVLELGISNCYDVRTLERLCATARIAPRVVQNRFYAETNYDRPIRAACNRHDIVYQSFWTLSANPHVLAHPNVRAIAKRRGITEPQVLFRALTQLGVHPLTGTTSERHMREDLAIFDFVLDEAEVSEVATTFA